MDKTQTQFDSILSKGKIGLIETRNRLVMPAMVTSFCGMSGEVTPQMVDYYVERTKGGVGLQILEGCYVTQDRGISRLFINHDNTIAGLHELVESIKEYDGVVFAQLNHQGKLLWQGNKTIGSLTKEEILSLKSSFLSAAIRAQKAGFDGIELHAAHGYLLNQFLSRLTNARKDEYGLNIKGRTRFLVDLIKNIKTSLGYGFPVIVRINGNERVKNGIDPEEAKEIAQVLEFNGADAIHVSSGNLEFARHWVVQPMSIERGCLVPLAHDIKKGLNIPVITVGRINDPFLANEIIASHKADFVAMGRGLIADPYLPNKIKQGKIEEINKCIACNFCIGKRHRRHWKLKCSINPEVGRERTYSTSPVSKKKRVLVIGGGPAGIECSTTLAQRGHEVILFEKKKELGGNLHFACLPPFKNELKNILSHQIDKIMKSDVTLYLDQEVNEKIIKDVGADDIVFATGSFPIPFSEYLPIANVKIHNAEDVLSQPLNMGNRVTVIGGGQIGCEVSEFLATKGKYVNIIEIKNNLAEDMEDSSRHLLLNRLKELNVKINLGSKVLEVGKVIQFRNSINVIEAIQTDWIVSAVGYRSNRLLYNQIDKNIGNIHLIGDCKEVTDIAGAIHGGAFAGRII